MQELPLVLEGATPEEVIVKAYTTHGPEVRLSKPERVRVGGVLGFFAKSRYRLEVTPEAPAAGGLEGMLEETPAVSLEIGAGRPRSFDEALARVSGSLSGPGAGGGAAAEEETWQSLLTRLNATGAEATASAPPAAAAPPRRSDSAAVRNPTPSAPSSPASTLSAPTPPGPPLSAPPLATAPLSTAPLSTAPLSTAPPPAPTLPAPTLSGHAEDEVVLREAGEPAAVGSLMTAGMPMDLIAEAMGQLDATASCEEILALLPRPRELPRTLGSLVAVVGPGERALVEARAIAADLGVDEIACARCQPKTPAARRRPAEARTTVTAKGRPTARQAATPARGRATARPATSAQAEAAGEFPPELLATNAVEAADLSPGWRRDRIGVVAVVLDAPGAAGDLDSARALLRAMRPSMTLALVDAAAKTEDIAYLAGSLGGVDALVAEGAASTITPLELTACRIPIARIDHKPATPRLWADLVSRATSRRAAAERG